MTDHMKATETLYNPDTLLLRVRIDRERAAWDAYSRATDAAQAASEAVKDAVEGARHADDEAYRAIAVWKDRRDDMKLNHPGGRP